MCNVTRVIYRVPYFTFNGSYGSEIMFQSGTVKLLRYLMSRKAPKITIAFRINQVIYFVTQLPFLFNVLSLFSRNHSVNSDDGSTENPNIQYLKDLFKIIVLLQEQYIY